MTKKAIHSLNGDSSVFNCSVKGNGVWARIVKDVNAMNDQGFIPYHFIKRNVGDGRATRFWKDRWMGVAALQHQFPHLFHLEVNQYCMLLDPNNGFTVKKTRIHLDNASLPDAYISTRWFRFIPKKVNIFVWHAHRDHLPTWLPENEDSRARHTALPSLESHSSISFSYPYRFDRWRFLNTPNALWVMTKKAIHSLNGDSSIFNCSVKGNGVWARIVKDVNAMNDQGFIPYHFIKRNVGDGRATRFWKDRWMGVAALQHQFPHLFHLEVNQYCMLLDPNNGFTVKKTRIHLDNASLPDAYISTRWFRFIPKKVNIFVWHAHRDHLPTWWNLSNNGVKIESILCPTCSSSPETIQHSLWTCSFAACVWLKVFSWLDLPYPTLSSLQDEIDASRYLWCGVVDFMELLKPSHLQHPMARNEIFDKITRTSFLWYTNRNRKANTSWNNWLQNPLIPYVL
ncbi:RNA-directed DNA polymerase, eukaryota [Artemisia annua]|uniref:RNA-directed DNA polymerase, eukaryota n=1 Tax=Artemisia annua TaxID=35608 RepID=A0A2U1Q268_ARTAN|nr:RNA-directed DNA polymerase, eukaryota [Artemisia annua]